MPDATTTPAHPRRRDRLIRFALAASFSVIGALGLGATLVHRTEYPGRAPLLVDTLLFTSLALCGLGLLRRRLWAARVATAILYFAFLGVLAALSLTYAQARTAWWYWLLPLALPALGFAVHSLRRQRAHWLRRW
ncbi:MAG: hypothetical protein H6977_02665 [Gammaproteobacteria bacterium]|nr:hypothetical protein [Gammaproteobacteria bacterium]MCP5198887.1 hypothetical protein [Gammaproteobacteria bacterium]